MVDNQKLFRVSKLEERFIEGETEDNIIRNIKEAIKGADGIVVSDFVYGVITQKILNEIIKCAKDENIKVFGDIQCSSQVGSILKFKNFSCICPNERELRIGMQDKISGIEVLSQRVIKETNCENLLLKMAGEGFIVYKKSGDKVISQHYPALSVNPLDVTGAGDSLLAVMAVGVSQDRDIFTVAAIGCCMSQIAVETMGNTPIRKTELKQKVREVFGSRNI